MSTSYDKFFLRFISGLIVNLFLFGIARSGDILFHEEVDKKAIIYRISPEGANLRKIGEGLSPKWSPDEKYISYVKGTDPTLISGLIVIEPSGKEIARISGGREMTSIVSYSWSPNSNGIALVTTAGRHDGSITYYDIKTRQMKILQKIEFKDLDIAFLTTTLEWASDGKQLLFSSWGLLPKEVGMILINLDEGTVKNLSDRGALSRFIENKVLFVIGGTKEIWTVNRDGSDKKKIFDVGMPIVGLSKAVNNRIILQAAETKPVDKEPPLKLYLFNLETNKPDLKEITLKNHLLFCPNISPDGKKFTAIGMRLKKDGQMVSEEEAELGYYLFTIDTEEVTLLKRFEDKSKGKGFWWGIYAGYGNHTSWSR